MKPRRERTTVVLEVGWIALTRRYHQAVTGRNAKAGDEPDREGGGKPENLQPRRRNRHCHIALCHRALGRILSRLTERWTITYEQQIEKWRKAMNKTVKKALSQKNGGRKLLIRAGILEKNGKRLAKPYR